MIAAEDGAASGAEDGAASGAEDGAASGAEDGPASGAEDGAASGKVATVNTAGKTAAVPLANTEPDVVHVLVKRLDPGIPLPVRAHPGDAGADLFAAADVELAPGQRAVVPTGLSVALPDGYAAFVHPRSGLAARHGVTLVNAPGTVDAGYRGEIRVTLLNTDASSPVRFQRGDRIAQLVIQRVERAVFHEVDTLPGSARGDAGFGSTGGHAATAGQAAGSENPATR